jgi:hypothetical protein
MCMQSPEAIARRESDVEPQAPATGKVCFDIHIFDGEGKWLGSGGVFPLSWITLTPEGARADEGEGAHLGEFLREVKNSS